MRTKVPPPEKKRRKAATIVVGKSDTLEQFAELEIAEAFARLIALLSTISSRATAIARAGPPGEVREADAGRRAAPPSST